MCKTSAATCIYKYSVHVEINLICIPTISVVDQLKFVSFLMDTTVQGHGLGHELDLK